MLIKNVYLERGSEVCDDCKQLLLTIYKQTANNGKKRKIQVCITLFTLLFI